MSATGPTPALGSARPRQRAALPRPAAAAVPRGGGPVYAAGYAYGLAAAGLRQSAAVARIGRVAVLRTAVGAGREVVGGLSAVGHVQGFGAAGLRRQASGPRTGCAAGAYGLCAALPRIGRVAVRRVVVGAGRKGVDR